MNTCLSVCPLQPAKPAEAAPAFMPSLLPHPAFVQAYLGQTFPPTSAAPPLGMYQPQLSPTAHAQLLEEIMRQKALQSMTAGSLSPFMMSSLPSTYPPPPTKDSPQNKSTVLGPLFRNAVTVSV